MTPNQTRRYGPPSVVLALLLALAGAAWSVRAVGPTGEEPAAASPAALAEQGLRPPLYQRLYQWTPAKEQIATAQQKLTIACMAKRGFTLRPAPVTKEKDAFVSRPTPFGLEHLQPPAEDGQAAQERPESAAFNQALYGDPAQRVSVKGTLVTVSMPTGGCQADSEEHMLGDGRHRWLELRIKLGEGEQEALRRLQRDPAYRTALEDWRTCMRESSIQAREPADIIRSLPDDAHLAAQPAARADVRCKQTTGFLPTAYARLAVMQHDWLDDNAGIDAERQTLLERQTRVAQAVLH